MRPGGAVAVGAVHAFIDAAEQKRRVLPAGVRRVNPVGQSRVYKVRASGTPTNLRQE